MKKNKIFRPERFFSWYNLEHRKGEFMQLPRTILEIMQTFQKAGYQAYAVGGCVRDSLLHKQPCDYDMTTNARPEQIMSLFEHTIPTGLQHGTVTIKMDDQLVEVTTFRIEENYADHRHPDKVKFVDDVKLDLARRDFTINAMAYSPQTGLIDPFNGQEDLKNKIIRTVLDPDKRFQEDALRMVRAHRFAAKLGFSIQPETLQAIHRNERLIDNVAVERLYKEWIEILKYDAREIANMTGLFKKWIPELEQCLSCNQNSIYHYTDALHHILDSVNYCKPFDEIVALSLLFHDLGKPSTRTTSEDGRDHFYKHPYKSFKISQRIVEDLKLSNKHKNIIPLLVLHHDDILSPALKNVWKVHKMWGFDTKMMEYLFKVQYCDIMAHSEIGRLRLKRWKAFKDFYYETIQTHPMEINDLQIDGNIVIKMTGLSGKAIRIALEECLEYCFYNPTKNNRLDILTFLLKNARRFQKESEKKK